MTAIRVRVEAADFDPGVELSRMADGGDPGAVASFIGHVRGGDDPALCGLTLEHYPGMTQAACEAAAYEAAARWPLTAVTVIHRHGRLSPGERIVLVAAASAHRRAALEACAFLIDWLKTRAPFWKREEFADGSARWVEARVDDEAAAARWHETPRCA
ncbi:MAG: molybdenum cofactor biosynthesis protein MoaE [Sphingomonadaceae bacterium]|nr:molybdenum cofactor biosynthesis protein MoaE [Sphingomonadaceae bacterium]